MTGLEAPVKELHIHKEARSGVRMGSPTILTTFPQAPGFQNKAFGEEGRS